MTTVTKAVSEVVNPTVAKMKPNTADNDGAKATESWVEVNGVATRVLCWGQPIDENGDSKDLNRVVLCVCGNPGISEFYEKFLQEVYKALKVPVWITSHAGTIFIFYLFNIQVILFFILTTFYTICFCVY